MHRSVFVILFLWVCLPLSVLAQTTSEHIDDMFNQYERYEQFSGAVLLENNGDIILRGGYGVADRELNVPASAENRFVIGSMSKAFNAALAVSLSQQGVFDLDDPVVSLWPEFNDPSGGHITMRQVLTHHSGLPHWGAIEDFLLTDAAYEWDPAELVNRYAETGLQFEPGSDQSYSSLGFMAAAVAMEQVTGTLYHDLLRTHLFEPLGMADTVADSVSIIENRAADYRYNFLEARYENGEFRHPSTQFGTGDILTTVDDLQIWASAIRGDYPDVLTPEILSVILGPDDGERAYGWNRTEDDNGGYTRVYSHGGLVAGFRSQIVIDVDRRQTLIMLGNLRDIDANRITRAVFAALNDDVRVAVPRDLMREILEVSATQNNDAVVNFIRTVLRDHADEYYPNPIGWVMAAVELRSDGACNRAIDIYDLWLELNPGHPVAGTVLQHETDCALNLSQLDRAERLIEAIEARGADLESYTPLVERLREARAGR